MTFTHPSLNLLKKVQTFLSEELDIASSISPKGVEKCFVLGFSKLNDIKIFGEYLYSNESAVVLKRKMKVFKELRNQMRQGMDEGRMFPHEFIQSEEYSSLVGSRSKFIFISPDGEEFPSAKIASEASGVPVKTIHRRAREGAKGWSRRVKTSSENREYDAFISRQTKKLFSSWLGENPEFY